MRDFSKINLLEPRLSGASTISFYWVKYLAFVIAVALATLWVILLVYGANTSIGNNITTSGTLSVGGAASFTTTSASSSFSGPLGVASTSPWGVFSVELTTTNPGFVVANNGSSTPAFYIGGVNQNGLIAIGTTSPRTNLDIQATKPMLSLGDSGDGNNTDYGWVLTAQNINFYVATVSPSGPVGIATSSLSSLTILGSNGFVGISTTTPTERLSVLGNVFIANSSSGTTSIRIQDDSSDPTRLSLGVGSSANFYGPAWIGTEDQDRFSIITNGIQRISIQSGNGNVGIGSTTAARLLGVQGGGFFTETLTAATLHATGSLRVATTSGTEITADSAATTSLILGSSASVQGGCIELIGSTNKLPFRIYISPGRAQTSAGVGTTTGMALVVEEGHCE